MITAIIPARGGSKGIPRKNLRTINGETLLARCIRTCKSVVGDVLVSTDDDEIAEEALRRRARLRWRPDYLSRDDSSTWDAVRHALPATEAEIIVLAQCTAPLLTPGDIRGCLHNLDTCDVRVACHRSHDVLIDADGQPINWTRPPRLRQDMEPQYVFSGSVWAFRREYLKQPEMSGIIGIVESENPMRLDIDTEDDLRLAEFVLSGRHSNDPVAEMLLTG